MPRRFLDSLMKKLLKTFVSQIPVALIERPLAHAISFQKFTALRTCRSFANREELWDQCLATVESDLSITFVEFGVWKGYSIKYFAEKQRGADSVFVGLDSFEGLPEAWAHLEKSHFSTGGDVPQTDDSRIHFIKGWFQDTFRELREFVEHRNNFIVHYDADLYSSTLFCLTQLDHFKQSYLAIFDEFSGHETRALYNYLQMSQATVEFLGKVGTSNHPVQVLCRITPH